MKWIRSVLLVSAFVPAILFGQDKEGQTVIPSPGNVGDMEQKASFLIGFDFIQNLKANYAEVDMDQLIAGMRACLDGKEVSMSQEEIQAVMGAFERTCNDRKDRQIKADAAENSAAGEVYLKTNGAKKEVVSLPSGVQFRVINQGAGATPTAEDRVKVHYTGKTIKGKVFDSSVGGEPATFPVGGLIKGMTEILQQMKVGDKWEVTIPAALAYGSQAPPAIGPNQVLIFELELLEIVK